MTHGSAGEAEKGSEAGRKAVRVSLTFQDFRSFITQYDSHISMGGMFIGTRSPLAPGTACKLDVKLKDGYKLIQGLGEVAWTRDRAQGPDRPPGMGVRFRELEESSRDLIFEIVDRRLVDGSGVFQLDRAGEPHAQDIPDLEEILRRAERRREEARQAELESTEGDPGEALPGEFSFAGSGEDEDGEEDIGSGEIVAEEIAPELATGVLFGEGLDWLKEGFSGESGAGQNEAENAELESQTSEQALQSLDELLKEMAPMEAPSTGELEALTAADRMLSDPVSVRPEPVEEAEERLGEGELFSQDLNQFLAASAGRPALPSEVLAADGVPTLMDEEEDGDEDQDGDRTVTLASLERTSRLPIEDLREEEMLERQPVISPGELLQRSREAWSSEGPSSEGSSVEGPSSESPASERREAWLADGSHFDDVPAKGAAAEESYYYGDKSSSRRPLLFVLLGLLVVAAVAFFYLRGGLGGGSDEVAEVRGPGVAAQQPATNPATDTVQVPVLDPVPGAPSDQDSAAQEESGQPGLGNDGLRNGGLDEEGESVDRAATVAAPPSASSLEPMTSVVSITAREVPEGTLITVRADGEVLTGRYRYALIAADSPRLLLKLLGVQKGSHEGTISVGTKEVRQIRTGYHQADSGQDLHIVLDLASPAIAVDRVEIQGSDLLLWAESR